ncbi:hypothetical protein ACHWQZ_G008272 [Mnemiopsis leidyi]
MLQEVTSSRIQECYTYRKFDYKKIGLLGAGGATVAAANLPAANSDDDEEEVYVDHAQATRYRRTRMFRHFCSFSSFKYKTELFMTGEDFLRAILFKSQRMQGHRYKDIEHLTDEEFQSILNSAPPHSRETRGLFRSLGKDAVISYPEYLFLVSILSKPRDHFLKTFQMIDVDKNWVLTKDEFELVERLFSRGVIEENIENTTLKVHFFKMDGSGVITFDDFVHFLDGLQKECLEVEFNEYAKGSGQIQEEDFAELLLSRTLLSELEKDKYRGRISKKGETDGGIHFFQYSQFMNLLNDIHDLEIALRMFQIAKKPVTPEEFQRAVRVCTGTPLDDRMVKLTFKIFDEDGDGNLSHEEFMKVMKDKIRSRGTVDVQIPPKSWKAFRKCVHERMTLASI